MKVLIIQSMSGPAGDFRRGQEREVNDKIARGLIKHGIAKKVEEEKKRHIPKVRKSPAKKTVKRKRR